MNKKAQELRLNVVIYAALILIIIAVVVIVLDQQTNLFKKFNPDNHVCLDWKCKGVMESPLEGMRVEWTSDSDCDIFERGKGKVTGFLNYEGDMDVIIYGEGNCEDFRDKTPCEKCSDKNDCNKETEYGLCICDEYKIKEEFGEEKCVEDLITQHNLYTTYYCNASHQINDIKFNESMNCMKSETRELIVTKYCTKWADKTKTCIKSHLPICKEVCE